jgi:hypothetical protein
VIDTLDVNGCRGVIYERIDGPTMTKYLEAHPFKVIEMARILAELQAENHRHHLPDLPSQDERLRRNLQHSPELPEDLRKAALAILDHLPNGRALCHRDLHPNNIIISGTGPVIIDWESATCGNPGADIALTSLAILSPLAIKATSPLFSRKIESAYHTLFFRYYIKSLRELAPQNLADFDAWQAIESVLRLKNKNPQEQRWLLKMIRQGMALPFIDLGRPVDGQIERSL